MIDRVGFDTTSYAPVPQKFEAGTPDIAAVIGLDAALRWVMALDRGAVARAEHETFTRGYHLLESLDGVRLVSPREPNVGILTFTLDGAHPHDVASLLDQDGICVRAGHHCTQPLHRRLGLAATVRASVGVYSGPEDVEALAASLERIGRMFA
jgi:cysteine desulfurase/selenocysteine lyase